MPSRHPSITYSSLPHLSTIINLQPDREPWCFGYAPSQGRRCHASTNAHGRRCAMDILDEATEDLRAGDSINDLLKELAPYGLCRRFHQNQASDLARRWRKQVSSFVESRRSSPTQRTIQNTTGIRRQVPRRQTSEEQFEVRLREMKQRIEELLWIEDFDGLPATSLRSQVLNDALHMMRTVGAINNSTTAIDNIAQPRGDSITPVETPIRNLPDSTRSQISRSSTSSREILVTSSETSSRRSEATTTMPPTSDSVPQAVNTERSTHSTGSATRKARVSRRPAEGECGICLCSLQEPQSYSTDDEEEEEDDEGDEETDEEEDEGQGDSDDSEDEQGYYSDDDEPEVEVEVEDGLVWCKAQCGVNYHRECIEKWLRSGHYDSCPTCRTTWRY
ncbi:hypothetical protein N7509_007055 [Penicillium cosmopolitanum]|uniref:RING-type domain-containing protein n=1 Tax=Penicillium cosmopolitanum TaxID=1131564 RepID=A0A9X0B7Z1_9EURO|nr:uncharacterized protein N7509_007055 [Penicillium cosmopolitanum]KAJ5391565.1 hypothetical protein N7509_007055 [Penicillium cosmopolitanum]